MAKRVAFSRATTNRLEVKATITRPADDGFGTNRALDGTNGRPTRDETGDPAASKPPHARHGTPVRPAGWPVRHAFARFDPKTVAVVPVAG